MMRPRTLDPNKPIQEVELPSRVGSWAPVGSSDFVGLGCEAGVLSNFVNNMGGQRTITAGVEDDACKREEAE